MVSRVNGFYYLLNDEWPPFGGDEAPAYPIRVGVPPPLDEYDRLKTGLRLLIGIPVWLLAIVQSIILGVCALIAWFVILFTGKLPRWPVQPDALRHGLPDPGGRLLPADYGGLPAVHLRGGWRDARRRDQQRGREPRE